MIVMIVPSHEEYRSPWHHTQRILPRKQNVPSLVEVLQPMNRRAEKNRTPIGLRPGAA